MALKLGLTADDIEHLGFVAYCKVRDSQIDSTADEALKLNRASIRREFDMNFNSRENLERQWNLIELENRDEALLRAFAMMIEANNAALVSHLVELGVLSHP